MLAAIAAIAPIVPNCRRLAPSGTAIYAPRRWSSSTHSGLSSGISPLAGARIADRYGTVQQRLDAVHHRHPIEAPVPIRALRWHGGGGERRSVHAVVYRLLRILRRRFYAFGPIAIESPAVIPLASGDLETQAKATPDSGPTAVVEPGSPRAMPAGNSNSQSYTTGAKAGALTNCTPEVEATRWICAGSSSADDSRDRQRYIAASCSDIQAWRPLILLRPRPARPDSAARLRGQPAYAPPFHHVDALIGKPRRLPEGQATCWNCVSICCDRPRARSAVGSGQIVELDDQPGFGRLHRRRGAAARS